MSGTIETINQLPALVTPASTDVYVVQQVDGTTRQATPGQVTALEAARAQAAEASNAAAAAAAQATANTASSTASAAVTTANNAETIASSAETVANTANATANAASAAAAAAQSTANSAQTAASTAQSTANNAATEASNAQTAASTALADATAAQSTANAANALASSAQPKIASALGAILTGPATTGGVPGLIAPGSAGHVLVDSGTAWSGVAVSGDGTLAGNGYFSVTKTGGVPFGDLATTSAGAGLNLASGVASVAYGFNTDNAIQGGPQSASFALAAPTSAAGAPEWRKLVVGDISGAAASGANSDITSISGLTTALSVGQGGTGAITESAARLALGAQASGSDGTNKTTITAATTLTTAQSGQTILTDGAAAAFTLTLPANVAGLNYTIYGNASYAVTVAAPAGNIILPDGTSASSFVLPLSYSDSITVFADGTNWRGVTFGQTVVASAVAANQAVQRAQVENANPVSAVATGGSITTLTGTSSSFTAPCNGTLIIFGNGTASGANCSGFTFSSTLAGLTTQANYGSGGGGAGQALLSMTAGQSTTISATITASSSTNLGLFVSGIFQPTP